MKKIVGTILAIALVASSVFAEVGISSWGRAVWAPIAGHTPDGAVESKASTYVGTSWGGSPRVGISVNGSSENCGFNIDMNADGFDTAVTNGPSTGINIGDTAYFWASPFEWLTVKIGKCLDDTGRGNAGFGSEDWLRMGVADFNDDFTFKRFGINNYGAIVKITPVEGLWVIASFSQDSGWDLAEDVYKEGQYGAGYSIANIGDIRAQYMAKSKTLNAAFDLKAIENVFVSVGAFIPFEDNSLKTISAYARFGFGAITLNVGEGVTLGDDFFGNQTAVGVTYDFGNGLALDADVRFQNGDIDHATLGRVDGGMNLSFLAGIKKSLTGGFIGVGFQGAAYGLDTDVQFNWAVPVVIQAGF